MNHLQHPLAGRHPGTPNVAQSSTIMSDIGISYKVYAEVGHSPPPPVVDLAAIYFDDGLVALKMELSIRAIVMIRALQIERRLSSLQREVDLYARPFRKYRTAIVAFLERTDAYDPIFEDLEHYMGYVVQSWHVGASDEIQDILSIEFDAMFNSSGSCEAIKSSIINVIKQDTTISVSELKHIPEIGQEIAIGELQLAINRHRETIYKQNHVDTEPTMQQIEARLTETEKKAPMARDFIAHACPNEIEQDVLEGYPRYILSKMEVEQLSHQFNKFPVTLEIELSKPKETGLSPMLQTVVKHMASKNEECSICQGPILATDRIIRADRCYHYWHGSCVDEWFATALDNEGRSPDSCPNCRTPFVG